jgi:3-phosphoshikimate 1-carboxyvinyltransferase
MNYHVKPLKQMSAEIFPPGDKSISHRLAILGALATGNTIIGNYCPGKDFQSTLHCLAELGVEHEIQADELVIHGKGLGSFIEPRTVLNAGNSGTTIRLLVGVLAAQSFVSTITGDDSLIQRPMKRIIEPLELMGAEIQARNNNYPPLSIRGTALKPINYILPVASAQVKSSLLLAALLTKGATKICDPFHSRNHTENLLPFFNAEFRQSKDWLTVKGNHPLRGIKYAVPGDFSSAAFFMAAALLLPKSSILLRNVGLNPTRTGLLEVLRRMNARFSISNERTVGNEELGDLHIASSELASITISKELIPAIIDELPLIAVLATKASGLTIVKDAKELRHKETDRIQAMVTNLTAVGIKINELDDGFTIKGPQRIIGGTIDSFSDHRIAMCMAIAALASEEGITINDADCIAISYPQFFDALEQLRHKK